MSEMSVSMATPKDHECHAGGEVTGATYSVGPYESAGTREIF
jgi:hypothetical protein